MKRADDKDSFVFTMESDKPWLSFMFANFSESEMRHIVM